MLRTSAHPAFRSISIPLLLLHHRPLQLALFRRPYSTRSDANTTTTVYQGPIGVVAKRLKLFSISSLALTAGISPFIFFVDVPVPNIARIVLVSAALFTSSASTGLIHWIMSPYVAKITVPLNPTIAHTSEPTAPPILNLHTYTWTSREHVTTLPTSSLEPSMRVFTTWAVRDITTAVGRVGGRAAKPKRIFYVHPELCKEGVMKVVAEQVAVGKK
ncbi:hypothetical protein BC937DRAFT_90149 [Endogone sp. FLAS-F59071]|nr:hypothetical protein BC937DRAFT_90149 [Endogone sp. FLAS-F59071]|eukprot:RUS17305.1 hypothetical protein BC937DRAFT_90149 [Endogone sp. FLAS-F59071]